MERTNVLLIVLDAVRIDHLSCYGHTRATSPTLDQLAEDGVQYTQSITAAPWTSPAHASLFTGLYPSRHRLYDSDRPPLSEELPLLAEELSEAGYGTMGFSNSYHTSTERGFARGFNFYHDVFELPTIRGHIIEPSLDYAKFFARYFLRDDDLSYFQLEKLKTRIGESRRPFFGFINLNSAHNQYDPPGKYVNRFEESMNAEADRDVAKQLSVDAYKYLVGQLEASEDEWELVRRWYDGEINYMDDLLDDLFTYLKDTGIYDETMIIVTSDHGEHFGERGLVYHQFSLFEELLHVPLIVKYPEQCHRGTSDRLTSLIDIAPTILHEAGVEPPETMQGRPLTDDGHDVVFAEYGGPTAGLRDRLRSYDGFDQYDKGLQAARTDTHKLIRESTGTETVYSLESGTESAIENSDVAAQLSAVLDETLDEVPKSRDARTVDDRVRDHLEKMGYM